MGVGFLFPNLYIGSMEKRQIAVFDFDGTLIRKDSLLEFIKFVFGNYRLYGGLSKYVLIIIATKLRLYHNGKAKEMLFSYFFEGMSYSEFCCHGEKFAAKLDCMQNKRGIDLLESHKRQGFLVFVVSASVEEWIVPWCHNHQIDHVIGTQVEVSPDGYLTGKFSSANCYGAEKVQRFLEFEPKRDEYVLYAYGDSRGDKEMIAFADMGIII